MFLIRERVKRLLLELLQNLANLSLGFVFLSKEDSHLLLVTGLYERVEQGRVEVRLMVRGVWGGGRRGEVRGRGSGEEERWRTGGECWSGR